MRSLTTCWSYERLSDQMPTSRRTDVCGNRPQGASDGLSSRGVFKQADERPSPPGEHEHGKFEQQRLDDRLREEGFNVSPERKSQSQRTLGSTRTVRLLADAAQLCQGRVRTHSARPLSV